MNHSTLIVVTVLFGSFAISLCRQVDRKYSFNDLERVAPSAETSGSALSRTKRQWDKYGVEGGLRGMLWGLILGGLFHAPPAAPAGGDKADKPASGGGR